MVKVVRLLTVPILVFQLALGEWALVWAQAPGRGEFARGQARTIVPGAQLKKTLTVDVESAEIGKESLPGGQALSRAVVPDKYVLGPGDGLAVNLWGAYEDSFGVTVTPDGKLILPFKPDLAVNGLTLAQLAAVVDSEAKRYYRKSVYSSVSLVSLRVFEVLVLGGVEKPGKYRATPVLRVSDLIGRAGGISHGGSLRHIQLRKDGQVYAAADLYAFLQKGEDSANPFVHDGDVIFVPPMGSSRVVVYVSEISTKIGGALVENSVPYVVEIQPGEGLSTVIDQVGGVTPWWDLQGVVIKRESKVPEGTMRIPVDLNKYYHENDRGHNLVMEPGDQVFIPPSVRRVFVVGMVNVPGVYTYFPGRTADGYVGQAGGATVAGDLGGSIIKRADGTEVPYVGTTELNVGDTVFIVEKPFKSYKDYLTLWGTVTGFILSVLGFIAVFGFQR